MLAGYAGQFSFGHIGFMGVGAYTAALFSPLFLAVAGTDGALCRVPDRIGTWLVIVNPIGVTSSTLTQDCLRQAMEAWGGTVEPQAACPIWLGIVLGSIMGGIFGLPDRAFGAAPAGGLSGALHAGLRGDPQGDDQRRDPGDPRPGRDGDAGALRRGRITILGHEFSEDRQDTPLLRDAGAAASVPRDPGLAGVLEVRSLRAGAARGPGRGRRAGRQHHPLQGAGLCHHHHHGGRGGGSPGPLCRHHHAEQPVPAADVASSSPWR